MVLGHSRSPGLSGRALAVDRARARDARRPLGRMAVFRPRLGLDRQPQPQHVHADRAGDWGRLRCTASSRRSSPASSRPRSAATAARSRSTSRPPRSSRRWCSSARCSSSAPGARRRAPSRHCSGSSPEDGAADPRRRQRGGRPARRGPRSATRCACGRARRSRSTASSLDGSERGRRVDDHGRADPRRERRPGDQLVGGTVNGTGEPRDARRARGLGDDARPDRADGGRGAAHPRADPAPRRRRLRATSCPPWCSSPSLTFVVWASSGPSRGSRTRSSMPSPSSSSLAPAPSGSRRRCRSWSARAAVRWRGC